MQAPSTSRADQDSPAFWSRPVVICATIFFIALGIRAAQFFFLRSNDPSFDNLLAVVDAKTYDDLSQTILSGDWALQSVPVHFMGPLYAYFLAVIYALFGHHHEAAHAVQYLLGAASAALIFLAARQWLPDRIAFLAGLFPALSATLIVYEGYLLPEGMIFFLASAFMLILGLARHHPDRWQLWLMLGIVLGLVSIQRASFLMFSPAFALWIYFGLPATQRRYKLARASLFLAAVILTIAPVTLHNRLAGGQWVLVTSNGPLNFYIGNGAEASGSFSFGPSMPRHERDVASGKTTWTELLTEEILADPTRWMGLMLKKSYLYWAAYDIPDNFNYALYKQFSPLTRWEQLPFYLVSVLGFIGMVALWPRRTSMTELYLMVLLCMASVVIVFVSGRFRLPAMAPMSVFAAAALWKMVEWFQLRHWRQLTAATAGVMALIIVLHRFFAPPFPVRINDYSMLASYYDMDANPDGAISAMRDAVSTFETVQPGHAELENARQYSLFHGRGELASRLARAGRWQEAKAVLERQIQSNFYDEAIVMMLAQSYIQLGEKTRARSLLQSMQNRFTDASQWRTLMWQAESLPD